MHPEPEIAPYSFSFVTGALFVPETLAVARLLRDHPDWTRIAAAIRAGNLLRQRTEASTSRLMREIRYRLLELSYQEVDCLVESDARDQRLLLFISVCRRYRFIREFTTEVLWQKADSRGDRLYSSDLTRFIEDRAEFFPEVARLTDKSKAKVRQVMLRIFAEAGLIDSPRDMTLLRPMPGRALTKLISQGDSKQLRWLLLSAADIRQISR